MKYEPLKGKVYHIYEKGINIFLYSSVKSAVQGLVEELKEKQAHARVYQSDESLEFYEGYEEGISDAVELIKKWFADVIKEDLPESRKETNERCYGGDRMEEAGSHPPHLSPPLPSRPAEDGSDRGGRLSSASPHLSGLPPAEWRWFLGAW